jgi:DnaK suppressor protein
MFDEGEALGSLLMASDAPTSEPVLADYRVILEGERDSLARQLAELGHGDAGTLNYDSNFADTSQVTAERGEVEALAGELKEALADVEAALQRVEDGTFGLCLRCGQPIAEARLEAMPAAQLCMKCASRP